MMFGRDIMEILDAWNFWDKDIDTGINRKEYIKRLAPLVKRKEILVLTGIRRCGKTTLMRQLMYDLVAKGVRKEQVLFLSLEDYRFRDNLSVELLEAVIESYRKRFRNKSKIYFFLDEIQKIKGWESFLRTKYDIGDDIKFIVSGSNASLLSTELSTLLTGRNISFQIKPLGFGEYLSFRKDGTIEEYLEFGGFPEVVLEKDERNKRVLLQGYFEDIVNRDIISRHNIRNPETVRNLARHIVENSGMKISFNKLSKSFGLTDDTTASYVSYMIESFLLIRVPFFSYSLKKRHDKNKLPKYYAADTGLAGAIGLNFSKNEGRKYENVVLLKLGDRDTCYWSDGKSEVDFISGDKAINVTATDSIPKREYEGLIGFSTAHKKYTSLIVSKNKKEEGMVSLKDFLLND